MKFFVAPTAPEIATSTFDEESFFHFFTQEHAFILHVVFVA